MHCPQHDQRRTAYTSKIALFTIRDFMKNYKIALLAGDGIGPEIMIEAVKILQLVGERNAISFELIHAPSPSAS
jgi:hypothetical protein